MRGLFFASSVKYVDAFRIASMKELKLLITPQSIANTVNYLSYYHPLISKISYFQPLKIC